MPRFRVTLTTLVYIEAVNEFEARHVATACWATHRASGVSVGHWNAEGGESVVSALEEITTPQPVPAAPRIPPPPPERRYSKPPIQESLY